MDKKIAVITGVSSGIGAFLFDSLNDEYEVFGTVRKHQKLKNNLIELDLTKEDSICQANSELMKLLGHRKIDLLINNAGINAPGPIESFTYKTIVQIFQTNLIGQIFWTSKVINLLNTNCKVIFINSKSQLITLPFMGLYSASKKGLHAITAALRYELNSQSIQVCSLILGNIKTPIWEKTIRQKSAIIKNSKQLTKPIHKAFLMAEKKYQQASELKEFTLWFKKIILKKKLKSRYYFGKDCHNFRIIKNLLPKLFIEKLIKKQYGF